MMAPTTTPAANHLPLEIDASTMVIRSQRSAFRHAVDWIVTLLAWCVAWLLDVTIGDPQNWPHPVRWIGNLIAAVQRGVRRYCRSDVALRVGGAVMWLVVSIEFHVNQRVMVFVFWHAMCI